MNKSHISWGSITVEPKENLSFSQRLFLGVSLGAVVILTFPHITFAATAQAKPLYFETGTLQPAVVVARQEEVAAAVEEILAAPAPDPRLPVLQSYLAGKRSPMADYAADLLPLPNYQLVIGISFAESNFCKYNIRPYNCWGIGGGQPEQYQNYPHAFERANLLITKYHERGLTSVELMRNRWVGWHNDNWIIAVNQSINEMKELGL